MNVFGAIEPNVLENGIDSHANFQDFPSAITLLYRVGIGDAWGAIYKNCNPKNCFRYSKVTVQM